MALTGITVLDASQLLPGGYATMLLGDLGAEIIKVERPGSGDPLRHFDTGNQHDSSFFLALSRNKKSVTIDLKKERGREIFHRLAEKSDVLLEQFRPGVMQRLGLDYESLKAVNPRLIYCSLSNFGQDGPYSAHPGHDLNAVGLSGLFGFQSKVSTPSPLPSLIADYSAGMSAVVGILAALFSRQTTGKGQFVDVSLLDGAMVFMTMFAGRAQGFFTPFLLLGAHACYGLYEARDGKSLSLSCLEMKFWEAFCTRIERPDLIAAHGADDLRIQRAVRTELELLFLTKDRDQWLRYFEGCDTCIAPVLEDREVFSDPQIQHRRVVFTADHPREGPISQVAAPFRLSENPARMRRSSPSLGQHTNEILNEAGYSEDDLKQLRAEGVI